MNVLPNGLLWKYIGLDERQRPRLDFLDDCLFRITQPRALNDPFEVKPRILLERYSEEDWHVARERALSSGMFPSGQCSDKDVEAFILAPYPSQRFDEKNFPGLYPAPIPELREEPFETIADIDEFRTRKVQEDVERLINEKVGIFSMTKTPSQLLMWAHYAAEHRGVVVGFNPGHPFFRQVGEFRRVEYLDQRVSISSNGGLIRIAGHQVKEGQLPPLETLLRKHPDWAYEDEWRLVVSLERADKVKRVPNREPIFLLRFPEGTIAALILGARVDADQVTRVYATMMAERWQHARLFRARLSENHFALQFVEIYTPVV